MKHAQRKQSNETRRIGLSWRKRLRVVEMDVWIADNPTNLVVVNVIRILIKP